MDLKELASWISAIMVIIGFLVYITKPILTSFTKINSNLTDITHSLDLINRSIEQSQSDRVSLHEDIKIHENRLDEHENHLTKHDEQIKTLFNQGGKNK